MQIIIAKAFVCFAIVVKLSQKMNKECGKRSHTLKL